jgi:hypothetical protein
MKGSKSRQDNFKANLRAALVAYRKPVCSKYGTRQHLAGRTTAHLCKKLKLGEGGYRWLRKLASNGASHIRGKRLSDLDAVCKELRIDPARLWDTPAPPLGRIPIDEDRVAVGWNPADEGWSKYPPARIRTTPRTNTSDSTDSPHRCDDTPSLHEVLALGVAEWCRRHNADYSDTLSELFSKLGFVQARHSLSSPATNDNSKQLEERPRPSAVLPTFERTTQTTVEQQPSSPAELDRRRELQNLFAEQQEEMEEEAEAGAIEFFKTEEPDRRDDRHRRRRHKPV